MKKIFAVLIAVVLMLSFSSCGYNNHNKYKTNYKNYSDKEKYTAGNFEYEASKISEIDLNWVSGSITLVESDSDTLSVYENGTELNEHQKLHWKIENNVLTIHFCESGYVGDFIGENKKLTVELPKNIDVCVSSVSAGVFAETLEQKVVDIDMVSGDVVINKVICPDISIVGVSGEVELNNVTSDEVEINVVSGDVKALLASCDRLDIESVSGKIEVTSSNARKMTFNTVSGKVLLTLNNLGATVSTKTTSGDINVDGAKVSGKNYVFGDGAAIVTIKTVSGNMTVKETDN